MARNPHYGKIVGRVFQEERRRDLACVRTGVGGKGSVWSIVEARLYRIVIRTKGKKIEV